MHVGARQSSRCGEKHDAVLDCLCDHHLGKLNRWSKRNIWDLAAYVRGFQFRWRGVYKAGWEPGTRPLRQIAHNQEGPCAGIELGFRLQPRYGLTLVELCARGGNLRRLDLHLPRPLWYYRPLSPLKPSPHRTAHQSSKAPLPPGLARRCCRGGAGVTLGVSRSSRCRHKGC